MHAVFRGGYVFYTPEDWELFGHHAYESTMRMGNYAGTANSINGAPKI